MGLICTSIVATLLLAGTTFADTIDVCPSCPYTSIQDAINDSSDGDVIQIGAGTFNEYGISPDGKAITIQGTGFGGTTIDAQQNGSVFVINSDEGPGTVINDLVIKGGSADFGGGISCEGVSVKITDCLITENTANTNGGGISCKQSSLTISGCTIEGNTAADNGCGISCDGSNSTISNCVIQNNTGGNWGSGIFCGGGSSPTITGCTISGNTTDGLGGGIYCYSGSSPTISDCMISNNTAGGGGGIYHNGQNASNPTIHQCTISNNTATNGGGGVFSTFDSTLAISNCTISGNTANSGGGIMISNASGPNFTDCTFENNTTGGLGGGIYCESSSPTIRNCTFDVADTIVLDNESTLNPIGACCYDGLCWSISEAECNDVNGSFTAETCSADTSCPTPCSSDSNNDGDVDVDDLMNLIGSFGACP